MEDDHLMTTAGRIENLQKQSLRLNESLVTKQQEMKNEIIDAISQQSSQLRSIMLDTAKSSIPLTIHDVEKILEKMLDDREERLFTRIVQHIDASRNIDANSSSTSVIHNVDVDNHIDSAGFATFYWGGKTRMVPEDFQFPLFDAKSMFTLWHFGNTELNIQPYKNLQSHRDDLRLKHHKTNFDRARLVMKELDNIFEENNLLGDYLDITQLDSIEARTIAFDSAYEKLIEQCFNGQKPPHKRSNSITLSTLADRLYKSKKPRL